MHQEVFTSRRSKKNIWCQYDLTRWTYEFCLRISRGPIIVLRYLWSMILSRSQLLELGFIKCFSNCALTNLQTFTRIERYIAEWYFWVIDLKYYSKKDIAEQPKHYLYVEDSSSIDIFTSLWQYLRSLNTTWRYFVIKESLKNWVLMLRPPIQE